MVEVLLLSDAERPCNQIYRHLAFGIITLVHRVFAVFDQIPGDYEQLVFIVVDENELDKVSHTGAHDLLDPEFVV